MSAGWGKSTCPVGRGARWQDVMVCSLLRHIRGNPDTDLCRNLKYPAPCLLDCAQIQTEQRFGEWHDSLPFHIDLSRQPG